ncbi:helix-turn-helix domain-containing protein [Planococcus sp. CAU13]|uniref:helix-turn-helix domain-containing protein n=1 Tax=Planococcus sp. CAU13 TaxID=1541197 RepID=UPI00052FDAF6|nr:AraC family transcriptional regulator [Planococcus sp. CAU13]
MDHYEVMERALLHIEDNLQQPLSLDAVAANSNISKYYFHRLFSAMMGCSLHDYILARRLNASIHMIQSNEYSLTDIAYRLNFGTQSSFTRAFKRQYGTAPSALKKGGKSLVHKPVPSVVRRSIKNINGDVVTDFNLTEFETVRLSGIAFEVDLKNAAYKAEIRAHAQMLLDRLDETVAGACYVIYSNCQPDSTRFKVLFGVPHHLQIEEPFYFTVDVPPLFCARFRYSGDLLDIGDVLKTDYARFLKISRQETEESDIELVQVFDDVHNLEGGYDIYAPIKKLPIDANA